MDFGEVLTAMVTPFTAHGELHLSGISPLMRHLAHGSHGLVILGTTGESPTLSQMEKLALVERVCQVREEMQEEISLVVGTGSYCTQESISFTKEMENFPIDGIMLVVPYYNRPSQQGLQEHFAAIAQETEYPVILYHVPGRCGISLDVQTVVELSQIPNIVAIKEASGNLNYSSKIYQETEGNFSIYSGDDSLTLPILSVGGVGVISVAAHLTAAAIGRMISSFKRGDVHQAIRLHHQLLPLFFGLFSHPNPIPIKEALNLCGLLVGPPRLPLTPLSGEEREDLRKLLKEYHGFIPCKGLENDI